VSETDAPPLAYAPELLRDAVFSPSGAIVRLRRGNKHQQLLAALMASCRPFHLPEGAEGDVVILEGIRRGNIEVM
jgi:hypothetical protein